MKRKLTKKDIYRVFSLREASDLIIYIWSELEKTALSDEEKMIIAQNYVDIKLTQRLIDEYGYQPEEIEDGLMDAMDEIFQKLSNFLGLGGALDLLIEDSKKAS